MSFAEPFGQTRAPFLVQLREIHELVASGLTRERAAAELIARGYPVGWAEAEAMMRCSYSEFAAALKHRFNLRVDTALTSRLEEPWSQRILVLHDLVQEGRLDADEAAVQLVREGAPLGVAGALGIVRGLMQTFTHTACAPESVAAVIHDVDANARRLVSDREALAATKPRMVFDELQLAQRTVRSGALSEQEVYDRLVRVLPGLTVVDAEIVLATDLQALEREVMRSFGRETELLTFQAEVAAETERGVDSSVMRFAVPFVVRAHELFEEMRVDAMEMTDAVTTMVREGYVPRADHAQKLFAELVRVYNRSIATTERIVAESKSIAWRSESPDFGR